MGAPLSVMALSCAPVDTLLWQRPQAAPVLTIVCRATFVLQPGEAVLAAQQEPLTATERPYPDGSSRGLYAPSDLVPMKPRADVVLVGQAFSPGQKLARSLVARLAVGEVDKRVEVFGDRHFDQQGELREGSRFTSMSLVYERAAGGPDTMNPLGVRPDVRDTYGRLALPNLQPTGLEIATPADPIAPVGFGPIAGAWPSRRTLMAVAAAASGAPPPAEWQGPYLPAELDPHYFQTAPRDQQMPALRGDERIVLGNLHPQHPELVIRLSGLSPRTFVEEPQKVPQGVGMRADTLWFDTSRQVFTVTWRGQLALKGSSTGLRVLVALEAPNHPLGWEDLERMARNRSSPGPDSDRATQTMIFDAGRAPPRVAALPFAHAEPAARAPREPVGGGGLPFRRPGESRPPPAAAPPAPAEETGDDRLIPYPPPRPAATGEVRERPQAIESPWARGAPPVVAPAPDLAGLGVAAAMPPVAAPPPLSLDLPAPVPRAQPAQAGVSPLQLLWFEPACVPALCKDPRFLPLLQELDARPLEGELDDPELAADVADADERRETFEILARGQASGEEGVIAALAGAVRDDGRLVQPVVLVAGELVFAFDELEALKATISAAAPYVAVDLEAKAMLDLAKAFLGSPGQPSAPAVAEGLATRIRETFERRGLVPAGFLDAQTARALLQGRHYQRRSLLGGPHVRALLNTGSGQAIPVYVDRDAAAKLPAVERLRIRMLAVVHPALDHQETHTAALHAVALGAVAAARR